MASRIDALAIDEFVRDPQAFIERSVEIKPYASGITVPGASNITWRRTGDFQVYINHCGPTAGMNIIWYYDQSNRLPGIYSAHADLFQTFYANMGTNRPVGTLPGQFVAGMNKTLAYMRHRNYNTYTVANNWGRYKGMIDSGYPVPMMFYRDQWVDATPDWSWHWVVGTAWLEDAISGGSKNYVYAADGWSRTPQFRMVGYDNAGPADTIVYCNVGYPS